MLLTAVLAGFAILAGAFLLQQSQRFTQEQAHRLSTKARVIDENIRRQLEGVSDALLSVIHEFDRLQSAPEFPTLRFADDVWVALAHSHGRLFLHFPDRPELLGFDLHQSGSFCRQHEDGGEQATVLSGQVATTRRRAQAWWCSLLSSRCCRCAAGMCSWTKSMWCGSGEEALRKRAEQEIRQLAFDRPRPPGATPAAAAKQDEHPTDLRGQPPGCGAALHRSRSGDA